MTNIDTLIHYSSGVWVIAGFGYNNYPLSFSLQVAVSSDNLKTWKFTEEDKLMSISYGKLSLLSDGNVMMLGTTYPNDVFSSTDGLHWEVAYQMKTYQLVGSAYGNGLFVHFSFGPTYAYRSVVYDGKNWKACDTFHMNNDFYNVFIAYDKNLKKFAVNGKRGYIYFSDDGCNWKEEFLGIGDNVFAYISTDVSALVTGENGLTLQR